MAIPTTRDEFKEYCLRILGKPVIEINVDDTQIEDRIDEALKYYQDYHFDGSQLTYVKHEITQDDLDNQYIPMDDSVIGVVRVLPEQNAFGGAGMFNVKYQYMLNNVSSINTGGMVNYMLSMQALQQVDNMFNGTKSIRFNRHTDRLYIDTDWATEYPLGSFVVLHCYVGLDGSTYSDVWGDRWLANYAAALIQEAWGRHLTKFVGVTMPGGLQFNGEQILSEAKEKRKEMEEEMINSFSIPVCNFIA